MALQELLDLSSSKNRQKIGYSEERIRAILPVIRDYVAFWREYPDIFVDFMQTGYNPEIEPKLKLRFYQRIFMRVAMRYRYVYAVYPRGYSKSFLAVLILIVRAILYPGAKLFTSAGGKQQAAGILAEKVTEILNLIPAFSREIDWRPGKTKVQKDYCYYLFKNGSFIDNLAANERTRGKRRTAGVLEECASMDGQILQEILIPTMNISRMCADGTTQMDEILNQSQLYITTAGYKNTFAYQKLISVLVQMIVEPDKGFILGGTYRVPIAFDMLNKNFVSDLKREGTFNEASFDREYGSHWTGVVDGAFFNGEKFDYNRQLQKPEKEASGRSSAHAFYVISVDVGRKGCQSVVCIFKVTPQVQGDAIKSLVNMYTFEDDHFEDQAIKIKKLFFKYNARRVVIDANGLGIGLLDYMIKKQVDSNGEIFPDFGVYNDDDGYYKKYRTNETVLDAIYAIKANAPINTEAYSIVQTAIESGRIKFLIDERTAKQKLLATKVGKAMTPEQRAEYLMPFQLTSILREEMLNLREENEGVNIILKQASKSIKKDKFSALCYGLYYIKTEEENKKRKKRFNAKEWILMN